MKKYCEECGKEVETKIVIKKETYDVCGEEVEVDAQVLDAKKSFFARNWIMPH